MALNVPSYSPQLPRERAADQALEILKAAGMPNVIIMATGEVNSFPPDIIAGTGNMIQVLARNYDRLITYLQTGG